MSAPMSSLRVFVNPATLFAVARLHAGCPIGGVTSSADTGIVIDGMHVVSDRDCPRNYWWPSCVSTLVDNVIAAALLADEAERVGRHGPTAGWVSAIYVCCAFAALRGRP